MSERALTAEERARVCVTMMPYGDWLRGKGHLRDAYDDIERTVASLVRENGDLRAALDGMFPVDERRVLEHRLAEATAALARLREALEGACLGADFAWGDPPTPVLVFAMKPDARVHAKMSAEEIVGVLADGARALAEEGTDG